MAAGQAAPGSTEVENERIKGLAEGEIAIEKKQTDSKAIYDAGAARLKADRGILDPPSLGGGAEACFWR